MIFPTTPDRGPQAITPLTSLSVAERAPSVPLIAVPSQTAVTMLRVTSVDVKGVGDNPMAIVICG